ncbi:hypothetical protein MHU86_16625 [Fragilaria crotonensis]|nr:hypothetical protein MHU86_16625 [Fragilaria crotonensis]
MKSSRQLLLGVVIATNASVAFAGFVSPTGRQVGALHMIGHNLHLSRWDTLSPLSSAPSLVLLFSSNSNNNIQDDPVALLPLWEAELLSSETSNDKRALLLERIENAKAVAEFGVRKAQFSFYDAFSNQDMESMRNVWSSSSSFPDQQVRCVHPGMPSLFGIEDVMRSWAELFMQSSAFTIQPTRTHIDISGQTALCSCIEETPGGGQLECLNVYRREGGSWKMILHMASPIIRMQQ